MIICEVSFGCVTAPMKKFTNAGVSPRSSPLGLYGSSAAFRSTPGLIFLFYCNRATEFIDSATQRTGRSDAGITTCLQLLFGGKEKAPGSAPGLFRLRLGCDAERLYVPELGQESVLIVVAAT